MKCHRLITIIVLGILTGMPSIVFGREKNDSLILDRIYDYAQYHHPYADTLPDNVYTKYYFNVERRNPILWLIPNMYVMAKGEREYIREAYTKLTFKDHHHYDIEKQALSGTIQHNRATLTPLRSYLTPRLYDVAIYDGRVLSPFHPTNRRYYRFRQNRTSDGSTRIDFLPKSYNTQLTNGFAIIETETGRILRAVLNGEYDMISYRTEILYSSKGGHFTVPWRSSTAATFKFMGNRVATTFTSYHNSPVSMADSIVNIEGRAAMDTLRPIPLTLHDEDIYERYEKEINAQEAQDTVNGKSNILKKIFWDTIGETLVTPIESESDQVYFSVSPIINPLYISYSNSRGLSYKMQFGFQYIFSPHRYLNLDPMVGYNFKIKQLYFNCPLRITYNPKRNGYAEIEVANGNRIGNGSVLKAIKEQYGDTIRVDDENATKFDDTYLRVFNNIMLFDWLDIGTSLIFHRRGAVRKEFMQKYGMPTDFRSFAPRLGIKILTWKGGPIFSAEWERGFKGIAKSNIDYERWEFDGQWKLKIPGLRLLNMRAGTGFYTRKQQNYFVDYENFRETHLPDGWEDNWSGEFQLLDDDEFNASNYYIRANVSYESPLLFATWLPYVGKYIEKERFYLSAVQVERSRPYFELGYGFSNRYLSAGAFASFRNTEFLNFGFKFEVELFRRW